MRATPNDDLAQMLASLPPGGTLLLSPGDYRVATLRVDGRVLQAEGDGVRIFGRVVLVRGATLVGLTVNGLSQGNAILCNGGDAFVRECRVFVSDDSKFPAIGVKGAQLEISDSEVRGGAQKKALVGVEKAQYVISRSVLDCLYLESASEASVSTSEVSTLYVSQGARMHLLDEVTIETPPLQRVAVVVGGALMNAPRVLVKTSKPEIFVRSASLNLSQVVSSNAATVVVKAEGDARCDVDSRACVVHREGEVAAEVLWRAADSEDFERVVAPQLAPRAVVALEEGKYKIASVPQHVHEFTLRGASRDTTDLLVTESLNAYEGRKLHVEDITLLQTEGHNACNVFDDSEASFLRTRVVSAQRVGTIPALYLHKGSLSLRETVVEAPAGVVSLTVVAVGGHVRAATSFLGWTQFVNQAVVELEACSAYGVDAEESRVSGSLEIHQSLANQRQLLIHRGSHCDLNELTLLTNYAELFVDHASLAVQESRLVHSAKVAVFSEQGTVHLPAASIFEEVNGQWQCVREPLDIESPPSAAVVDGAEEGGTALSQTAPGDPMSQINELIGLETVKRQIDAFMNRVKFNQRRAELGLAPEPMVMHSMFLGNPGTGKTTVARLLGQALYSAGAVRTNTFVEVGRADLVAEFIGKTAQKTNAVLEEALGGVLFIDEAYDLHSESGQDFGKEAVTAILTFMENHRDDIVIIFAGYTDLMQDFLAMNPGLKSRIPNRFDFADYSADELAAIGAASLSKKGYTFDEVALHAAIRRQYRRSGDGSNGRWVRNFEDSLIGAISTRLAQTHAGDLSQVTNDEITSVTDADIRTVTGGAASAQRVDALLDELENLIGLEEVKQWTADLVQVAEANQRLEAQGLQTSTPTYHMVFSGNPGTGKTTVARIVAEIFHALGILESPTVKEVTRADLVGSVIGATEKQTTRALDEALGGVLFIDEAYQLTSAGSSNDFGLQAVETLLPRLENDRGKFIAILAGYTDEMEEFLDANPGLRSRIPNVIEFPDYSSREVARIVAESLKGRGWSIDTALLDATVVAVYEALPTAERSNGRWARNFADRLEHRHKLWIARTDPSGEDLRTITEETVRAVGGEFTQSVY